MSKEWYENIVFNVIFGTKKKNKSFSNNEKFEASI